MANSYIGRQGREQCFRKVIEQSVLDQVSGCRIWPGNVTEKRGKKRGGYGKILVDGKDVSVHRLIFEEFFGPHPQANILHHCDNRLCTEIMYLYAGTNRKNIEDKIKRDRSGKKLNIEKVRRIKAMLAQGIRQSHIARQFGVHDCTIAHIRTGRRWAHVHNTGGPDSVHNVTLESGT